MRIITAASLEDRIDTGSEQNRAVETWVTTSTRHGRFGEGLVDCSTWALQNLTFASFQRAPRWSQLARECFTAVANHQMHSYQGPFQWRTANDRCPARGMNSHICSQKWTWSAPLAYLLFLFLFLSPFLPPSPLPSSLSLFLLFLEGVRGCQVSPAEFD